MDTNIVITSVVIIVAILLVVKFVINPILKILATILILFVVLYIITNYFEVDVNKYLGPFSGFFDVNGFVSWVEWVIENINIYKDKILNKN